MADVDFLTLDDVQFIHRDQTTRYGGDPGIRDRNLLDSALAQPRASFGAKFLHAFPFEMAAAYLFHIVRNHPFLDGNKRTGAVAALVFLELNGILIQARPGALYEITMGVATGAVTKDQVAAFLRVHAVTS